MERIKTCAAWALFGPFMLIAGAIAMIAIAFVVCLAIALITWGYASMGPLGVILVMASMGLVAACVAYG